jgi:alanine dehydrogenase
VTTIPVIGHDAILSAVSPERAIQRVSDAFIAHHKGAWKMPAKVYLDAAPLGDFRAMPAMGEGLAILKWVTSFPGNSAEGRPVVYGTILVSNAETGEPVPLVDGRAVTALRTGAAAAVAARALARNKTSSAGLIGCGLHGRWAALCLATVGYESGVCTDLDPGAAQRVAAEVGWDVGSREEAIERDVVTLVTPGNEPVIGPDELRPGTHVNALGADGSGKAEMAIDAVVACELFCDEWAQASHGGELTGAVEEWGLQRSQVTDLGAVLAGDAPGRSSDEAVTLFDSTGLAIQDLALVIEVLELSRSGVIQATEVDL